jgi:hypothetical protein
MHRTAYLDVVAPWNLQQKKCTGGNNDLYKFTKRYEKGHYDDFMNSLKNCVSTKLNIHSLIQ